MRDFFYRLKEICLINFNIKGRASDIIFVLSLISIISFSIFIYRSSTNFYGKLDQTMKNSMNLNVEITQNEHTENLEKHLEDLLNIE